MPPDAAAERLVGEPAQRVHGAQQLAVLEQRFGEGVLAGAGLQAGDEQGGGDMAEQQRPTDPLQIVPVLGDQVGVGAVGEQRPGQRPALVVPAGMGPPQLFLG